MTTLQNAEQTIRRMLELHPRYQARVGDETVLLDCIEACMMCAEICPACADTSLAEPDVVAFVKSIRLCTDCGAICALTAHMLMRQTDTDLDLCRAQVRACAEACRICAMECERHAAHHEHHRICAETCRRCEHACNRLLQ